MASATPLAIDARDVARRFDTTWVLRGATLTVAPGEVVGLLGANGSGKSTMLRIVSTLLRPHAGSVRVLGHDVGKEPEEVRARIGFLAHSPGLYDDLTVRENLVFAAAMLDRHSRDVCQVLERVGLTHVAGDATRGISSGLKRRLALARVILVQPRLLLLDEPYSNLDTSGIELVNSLIAEWTNDGVAALVVVHELTPAAGILNRTVTIQNGRVASERPELPALHAGLSSAVNG